MILLPYINILYENQDQEPRILMDQMEDSSSDPITPDIVYDCIFSDRLLIL